MQAQALKPSFMMLLGNLYHLKLHSQLHSHFELERAMTRLELSG